MTDANDNRSPRGKNESTRTEAQFVRADSLEARNEAITSDGTLTPVPMKAVDDFGVDSTEDISDASGWVNVRGFIWGSVEAAADTAGNGNPCDFTVQGKYGANGAAVDILAATTVTTGSTDQIVTEDSIKPFAYVRVLENGTSGDTQEVRLMCK